MKGYLYILKCSNGQYYTGSTRDLEIRLAQHQKGEGANFTRKHLPVQLVYFEEFQRIDEAFYREKQVQGWSRKKKEALVQGKLEKLHELSECKNKTHFKNAPFDSAQGANHKPLPQSQAPLIGGVRNCSLSGVEMSNQNEIINELNEALAAYDG